MGQIKSIAKWNLENDKWEQPPILEEVGRSFSIASYGQVINNNDGIDYIIIAPGSRVEDHSKDFLKIKEKEVNIGHVISYFERCNGNYNIQMFLMDADAPIKEDAKLLANYIDYLASLSTTNSINIIGLSKCAVMNFYIPKYFKNINTFAKTNIYSVAAPYNGTKMASPLIFYPELKQVVSSKISNKKLADLISRKVISIYEGVSSNSHMDYDIAIPNGIPNFKRDVYDETFIENVFCADNVDAIKNLNSFKNFLTGIDLYTLKEAIRTMNFAGIGLCILDDVFFNGQSDGMVYTSSQRKVEDVLDTKSYRLASAHHNVTSNNRVFNDILGVVDDTIAELNEKNIKIKKLVK